MKRFSVGNIAILAVLCISTLIITGCSTMNNNSLSSNSATSSSSNNNSINTVYTTSSIFMLCATIGAGAKKYINNIGSQTSELDAQYPIPRNIIVKSFTVNVSSSPSAGNTYITLRKNAVDTAINLTIPPNAAGIFSSDSIVTFNKSDLLSIEVDDTGSSGITTVSISFEMQ